MSIATCEILNEKVNNEAIVSNEMKLVEEMIKGNGPRGQKNFLLGANRQKNLIISFYYFYFFIFFFSS